MDIQYDIIIGRLGNAVELQYYIKKFRIYLIALRCFYVVYISFVKFYQRECSEEETFLNNYLITRKKNATKNCL